MSIWEILKDHDIADFKGNGLELGGYIYVLDIDNYLKMKEKELSIGTLLRVTSLYLPLAPLKLGQDGIYQIKVTSIDETINRLFKYISMTNKRYVRINELGYYKSYIYDKKKDCFFIDDENEIEDYYWDGTYGNSLFKSRGNSYYAVSPEQKMIMFSMSNALNLMIKAKSLDDAVSNLKEHYIYDSKFKDAPLKHGLENLECYSRPPKITFNKLSRTNVKWFSFIRCEVYLVSRCATRGYLEEHRRAIYKDLSKRIQREKRFINAGIPIGCFKVGGAVLTADNIFIVTFQLKLETEDDIEG